MKDEEVQRNEEIRELVSRLGKLALLAAEVANSIPEEYRKEAFVETYKYLLVISRLQSSHIAATTKPSTVKEIASRVEDNVQALAQPVAVASSERLSLVEFINKLKRKPKNNPEWITTFAYYMKYYQGKKTFQPREVKDYFIAAGLPVPKNIPRDTKTALKRGYLALDLDSKNIYYITRKGEELVRGMFSEQTEQE